MNNNHLHLRHLILVDFSLVASEVSFYHLKWKQNYWYTVHTLSTVLVQLMTYKHPLIRRTDKQLQMTTSPSQVKIRGGKIILFKHDETKHATVITQTRTKLRKSYNNKCRLREKRLCIWLLSIRWKLKETQLHVFT